jgi:hypothetical protein
VAEIALQDPVIVKIVEPEVSGLGDILLGALGLSGVLLLFAVVAAVAFGGLLYWFRSRERDSA